MASIPEARASLAGPLLDLVEAPGTTSNQLHALRYYDALSEWFYFREDVAVKCNAAFRGASSGSSPEKELLHVGNKTSVQGRFQQNVDHVLMKAFEDQGIRLYFGDFRSSNVTYDLTPDVVVSMPTGGTADRIAVVGQLEVPWQQQQHSIQDAIYQAETGDETRLRRLIAQPLLYMKYLQCKYGFLSTYSETVFLRQNRCIDGTWSDKYSPCIYSTESYRPTDPVRVSMR